MQAFVRRCRSNFPAVQGMAFSILNLTRGITDITNSINFHSYNQNLRMENITPMFAYFFCILVHLVSFSILFLHFELNNLEIV